MPFPVQVTVQLDGKRFDGRYELSTQGLLLGPVNVWANDCDAAETAAQKQFLELLARVNRVMPGDQARLNLMAGYVPAMVLDRVDSVTTEGLGVECSAGFAHLAPPVVRRSLVHLDPVHTLHALIHHVSPGIHMCDASRVTAHQTFQARDAPELICEKHREKGHEPVRRRVEKQQTNHLGHVYAYHFEPRRQPPMKRKNTDE
jgi:hypothetical protein